MDKIFERVDAWLIALVFAGAMLACWILGWRRGRRAKPEMGDDPGTKFTDASMALLGLLIAFTFSMALNRYQQRRLAVVAESNAIGDFYTCASLLKEPFRTELQNATREYARLQLTTPYESLPGTEEREATNRSLKVFNDMTAAVDRAISAGTPIAFSLTNTLTNVSSCSASRLNAYQDYLPWSIIVLLFLCSVIPAFLIGEKQGMSQRVHVSGSMSFILLVTLAVFVTVDLNQSRHGLITVSQESLERTIQSMGK